MFIMAALPEQQKKHKVGWLRVAMGILLAVIGTKLVVWGSRAVIKRISAAVIQGHHR